MALPLTARIVMATNRLNSTKKEERGPDWWVACCLLTEALGFLQTGKKEIAEAMLKAARPYIEVAAP